MVELSSRMVDSCSRCRVWSSTTAWLALLSAFALSLGCNGGGDSERHRVSGTVTLDGQPVPNGMITFEPDFHKGNTGPQGIATIRDGRFDTNASGGRGIIGGPHRVRIEGYRGELVDPELADPTAPNTVQILVNNFETEVDLPKGDTTHDFVITSDELRGLYHK